MVSKFVFLLIALVLTITVSAQRPVYRNSVLSSLEKGEMPKFSKEITAFFQERNESAVVLYHLMVDTTGFVKEFKRIPIGDLGNSIDSSSYIWNDIYHTIDSNIKEWKFKPDYWSLNDKKTKERLNKMARTRPRGGYQYFFVFFKINSDIIHNPIYIDIFN